MKKIIALLFLSIAAVAYGATTYTTNYNFGKPGDGDANFGETIRDNWDEVDTQLNAVSDTADAHIADPTDAHDATAISTTAGEFLCTAADDVQEYLDCLDGTFDPSTSGIVLLAGAQTITGAKTFSVAPIFSSITSEILSTNGSGQVQGETFNEIDPLTTKGDLTVHDGTDTTRLAVGSDDQILVANSSETTGLEWQNPNPRWRKFSYTYEDFSAAATSFGVTAFSLSAAEGIDAVIIKHSTAFSGGLISAYTVEVGVSGDTNRFADAFNVFQSAGNTTSQTSTFLEVPDFGSTKAVTITARSTGDDLDAATAGAVDVYVRTFVLP